jgi:hypothetical protein
VSEIAVVTSVTAGYDWPRRDRFADGVDYLFYCDEQSRELVADEWQARELEPNGEHPRRVAKWPKLNPHRFAELRGYRFVVWVDGGIHIRARDFPRKILEHLGPGGIVLSPHFDGRRSIYSEAEIRPPKYADEPLDEQIAHYHAAGYPGDDGLFECGVIARDMRRPEVAELGALWQAHVDRFSYQDQVSLPFCLWRLGLVADELPRSFRDMRWVRVSAHRREEPACA